MATWKLIILAVFLVGLVLLIFLGPYILLFMSFK